MSEIQVQDLEGRIGVTLPLDYRQFLVKNTNKFLDEAIEFQPPRSGVIDEILTVGDVLENDEMNQIGLPDRSLMHIGGNLMGGYLYLDMSEQDFGKVFYIEDDVREETFPSFASFLSEPRSKLED